ncbi:gluconate 2-dehydrogenase subunit 3 family protein [Acidisoma cellulosilytica]|uniref:Gluconate 2-dehydrogenase subunit 3 family protein n=1 Tax=Acidisoma cellulosilyticum TaxID=2802395 RepID=A0A964E3F3_9PROT|nr:gluconate 2-dehydrogenase subunit 3 family protein [Acidisoma cellulosilyticum]
MPWSASAGTPPPAAPAEPYVWEFFTADEAALVGAIADRIIPADELSIGGKEAGCAVFIDKQLAGQYGQGTNYYLKGPYRPGTPQQGPQTLETFAQRYRQGLAAMVAYCASKHSGKAFIALSADDQDALLHEMEGGAFYTGPVPSSVFFNQLIQNVREGYFADPIYGGNKDMAGWKLLGFPGARYDYRDVIGRRGEKLDLEPVSLMGRPGWNPA